MGPSRFSETGDPKQGSTDGKVQFFQANRFARFGFTDDRQA